jgi:hypothetical protein
MTTLNEDGFHSKTKMGPGYVGLSYDELWEAVAEDRIPGKIVLHKTLAEAKGHAVLEFDRSKVITEGLSLQPALVAIHTNMRGLNNFLAEREMDAMFINEGRDQIEKMAWFFRTSPMVKSL